MTTNDPRSTGGIRPPTTSPPGTTQSGREQQSAGNEAPSAVSQVKDAAGQVAGQATEKASQLVGQATEQAKPQVESQKGRAADTLETTARAMRQTGRHLREQDEEKASQYIDRAAGQVDRFADYLRERNLNELVSDAEHFARSQPAVFLGGTFAFGVLATRFLKSSAHRSTEQPSTTRGSTPQTAPVPPLQVAAPRTEPQRPVTGGQPGPSGQVAGQARPGMATQTPATGSGAGERSAHGPAGTQQFQDAWPGPGSGHSPGPEVR
ncbi:MAG: hypothetical protein ACR2PL_26455 [Dehalococcoidia bacterium]